MQKNKTSVRKQIKTDDSNKEIDDLYDKLLAEKLQMKRFKEPEAQFKQENREKFQIFSRNEVFPQFSLFFFHIDVSFLEASTIGQRCERLFAIWVE